MVNTRDFRVPSRGNGQFVHLLDEGSPWPAGTSRSARGILRLFDPPVLGLQLKALVARIIQTSFGLEVVDAAEECSGGRRQARRALYSRP